MVGNDSTTSLKQAWEQDLFRAAAALACKDDYGTLILDGRGNIRSCGTSAGQMFRGCLADLYGKPISAFIADFSLSESSQSYGARYIAHLCAEGGWRKFKAVDVHGQRFPVELCLSRVRTDGQDIFLLSLRRPESAD